MKSEPNVYRFRVHFDETDPGGVLFFGRLFFHAHRAYENFLRHRGLPLGRVMKEWKLALPIRKAEAEFFRPLHLDQCVVVEVTPARLGHTAFELDHRFIAEGTLVAQARTVHVAVGENGRPIPIPTALRRALTSLNNPASSGCHKKQKSPDSRLFR